MPQLIANFDLRSSVGNFKRDIFTSLETTSEEIGFLDPHIGEYVPNGFLAMLVMIGKVKRPDRNGDVNFYQLPVVWDTSIMNDNEYTLIVNGVEYGMLKWRPLYDLIDKELPGDLPIRVEGQQEDEYLPPVINGGRMFTGSYDLYNLGKVCTYDTINLGQKKGIRTEWKFAKQTYTIPGIDINKTTGNKGDLPTTSSTDLGERVIKSVSDYIGGEIPILQIGSN